MRALMRKCWSGLRDAEWLDAERALAYARILFFFSFAGALIWIALAQGGIDRAGKPLGTDFVSFWTASELALQGHAADVYNIAAHWGAQRALFGDNVAYDAFFYPPPYLLICLLLAALPYFWSLAAWLGVDGLRLLARAARVRRRAFRRPGDPALSPPFSSTPGTARTVS